MSRAATTLGPPARGLTLLELAIVMAVLAVLSALAAPSMAARLRAERLLSAAEMFAADIADARHEAARRGRALHVQALAVAPPTATALQGGKPVAGAASWCWAVATQAACPCAGETEFAAAAEAAVAGQTGAASLCRLKTVPAREHPGVALLSAEPVRLDPDGQASAGLAAVFAAGDRQLQVQVSRFGRARVCDPDGRSSRVPRC
jgi:type IV fimbrial biogenesis protein FimT